MYGLPKIRNADVPLKSFVSCVSAYLAYILSPLTVSSDFAVNNSAHFVSTVSSERVLDNKIMVSNDI